MVHVRAHHYHHHRHHHHRMFKKKEGVLGGFGFLGAAIKKDSDGPVSSCSPNVLPHPDLTATD